jgi:hypothetical protein
MTIALIKDSACFRGTIKSILEDSDCTEKIKSEVLKKVNLRTNGDITNIRPSKVEEVVKDCFRKTASVEVLKEADFENLETISNTDSFGILFWRGNKDGGNQHATRFVRKDNNKIVLMDPTSGQLMEKDAAELFNFSTLGFDFIKLEKNI